MKPWDFKSWLILSSWSFRITVSTCFLFSYWSFLTLVCWLVSLHRCLISWLGDDLLSEGSMRFIPYFVLLRTKLLNFEVIGSSGQCLTYLDTTLSRFSISQVLLRLAIVKFQERLLTVSRSSVICSWLSNVKLKKRLRYWRGLFIWTGGATSWLIMSLGKNWAEKLDVFCNPNVEHLYTLLIILAHVHQWAVDCPVITEYWW